MIAYHNNLSRWYRGYLTDLYSNIKKEDLSKRFENINSPGWTLMHLIVEGELALKKLKPDHVMFVVEEEKYVYGSEGNSCSDAELNLLVEKFEETYDELEKCVNDNLESLYKQPITDEALKGVLKTDLDFYLHMLITHVAMHCDALLKWRLIAGYGSPY